MNNKKNKQFKSVFFMCNFVFSSSPATHLNRVPALAFGPR